MQILDADSVYNFSASEKSNVWTYLNRYTFKEPVSCNIMIFFCYKALTAAKIQDHNKKLQNKRKVTYQVIQIQKSTIQHIVYASYDRIKDIGWEVEEVRKKVYREYGGGDG